MTKPDAHHEALIAQDDRRLAQRAIERRLLEPHDFSAADLADDEWTPEPPPEPPPILPVAE